ncbi:MAG: CoA pyrophosphatase [Planktotalea sp.]|uniref:CoA pyrophosphatase n=1 Tax=Planktotalea sp. TaxID=2029877 RepID=UPI003C7498AD
MPETIDHFRLQLTKAREPSSDYDLNPDISLPEGRKLRAAAVLLPLIQRDGAWHVILTMRSSALKHHPGQIAFPGGKQDDNDADLVATALREAEEEIGLPKSNVEVVGDLGAHETVTGFTVTPIVGVLKGPFDIRPETGEVAEVFHVPLDFLAKPENFKVQSRRWRGKQRHYYTIPYGPYYIWGATARMLRAFADTLDW